MNGIHGLRHVGVALMLLILAAAPTTVFGLGPIAGAIVAAPAPPSVVWNQFQSNTGIFLIEERMSAITSAAISVDVDGTPGLYDQIGDLHVGAIALGTVVDVHLLHFDPINVPVRLSGSVTFAKRIVGLALSPSRLLQSDQLGAPGTIYPTTVANGNFREFEFVPGSAAGDSVTISPDRRTLTVDFGVTVYYDEVRVFTSVPEPSATGLGATGVLLTLIRRRRCA